MGHKKNPKPNREDVAKYEAKAKQVANMPMNKDFLNAKDEFGNPKYPIADKLYKYTLLKVDDIMDLMRQISAYVAQIKHHKNRIERLYDQYLGKTPVVETDEFGRKYTKEELQLKIVSEKIAIPRDLSEIRKYAIHKLLPLIDGVRLTGEEYNRYIVSVTEQVKKLGYDLVPDKVELIYTEFDD